MPSCYCTAPLLVAMHCPSGCGIVGADDASDNTFLVPSTWLSTLWSFTVPTGQAQGQQVSDHVAQTC